MRKTSYSWLGVVVGLQGALGACGDGESLGGVLDINGFAGTAGTFSGSSGTGGSTGASSAQAGGPQGSAGADTAGAGGSSAEAGAGGFVAQGGSDQGSGGVGGTIAGQGGAEPSTGGFAGSNATGGSDQGVAGTGGATGGQGGNPGSAGSTATAGAAGASAAGSGGSGVNTSGSGGTSSNGGTSNGGSGGTSSNGGASNGGSAGFAGATPGGGTGGTGGSSGLAGAGPVGPAGPVCQQIPEDQLVTLACPATLVMTRIDFASYGTPTGTCGAYAAGACNYAATKTTVANQCLGEATCTFLANNATFGNDCPAIVKSFYGQASCGQCVTALENQPATFTCPAGSVITSVDFASYGNPAGTCGTFAKGSCDAAQSQAIVSQACVGKTTCTLQADNTTFTDPCFSVLKRLHAQVTCGKPLSRFRRLPSLLGMRRGEPPYPLTLPPRRECDRVRRGCRRR